MNLIKNKAFNFILLSILAIIALAPVLLNKYFPTVDGPAHLYNAHIIQKLAFDNIESFNLFFEFNSELVPNWIGHFIAAMAGVIFPVWIVEKIIVLLVWCLLPFAIVTLARAYKKPISLSYALILPIQYNLFLYLGFFNFLIGISVCLISVAVCKRLYDHWSVNKYALFLLLVQLVYFSHLMIFIVLLLVLTIQFLFQALSSKKLKLKFIFTLLLAFVPGLFLSTTYFLKRELTGFKNVIESYDVSTLIKWIYSGSPLIGLNEQHESIYTMIFGIGILAIFFLILIVRFKKKYIFKEMDFIALSAMVILLLYFVVPDGFASGGFISLRLLYLFYLLVIIYILFSLSQKAILIYGVAFFGFAIFISTFNYRIEVSKDLNADVIEVMSAVDYLPSETVLLPLNYSTNWLHTNISNYLGAENNIVVLDNYEALFNQFPIVWKNGLRPDTLAGTYASSLDPIIDIEKFEKYSGQTIDAVSRWKYTTSLIAVNALQTDSILFSYFNDHFINGGMELFYNRKK